MQDRWYRSQNPASPLVSELPRTSSNPTVTAEERAPDRPWHYRAIGGWFHQTEGRFPRQSHSLCNRKVLEFQRGMTLGSDGGGNSAHRLQIVTIAVSLGVRGVFGGRDCAPEGPRAHILPTFLRGIGRADELDRRARARARDSARAAPSPSPHHRHGQGLAAPACSRRKFRIEERTPCSTAAASRALPKNARARQGARSSMPSKMMTYSSVMAST